MLPNSQAHQAQRAFALTLDWLRQAIARQVASFTIKRIKTGAAPATVYRVILKYAGGDPGARSLILKAIAPDWPDDPLGADRERWFYSRVWPELGLRRPRLYYNDVDPETCYRIIVMEDLAGDYRFPPPTHHWSPEEMRCLLRAYAWLHARGQACLPGPDQRAWLWQMALQRRTWRAEEIVELIDGLVRQDIWARLPGVNQLVGRTLAEQATFGGRSATLLHNDVYPPNIALPHNLNGEAILLDWEMLGWGMAELDLAFMFMQPFRSAAYIDRMDALDYYWDQRRALEGSSPASDERWASQRHADALWAFSLVPVAHHVATERPYRSGSAPGAYWDAMFGVLRERLTQLCEEV
jgi:hypothetical protein